MKKPIEFGPVLHTRVWGGSRLANMYQDSDVAVAESPGESWLLSDLPDKRTTVANGPYEGMTVRKLAETLGEACFGTITSEVKKSGFPLLLKIIDAGAKLSLQVHPDDETAQKLESLPRGKSECWYVLDSDPGSYLILGTDGSVKSCDDLLTELEGNNNPQGLNKIKAERNHCFSIPAGLLHSIGGGVLLAEIQQSSDITYRVHDWGRMGLDGKPRELHLDKARKAIKPELQPGMDHGHPGWSDDGGFIQMISICRHYYVEKIEAHRRFQVPLEDDSPSVLIPLSHDITTVRDHETSHLKAYTAYLIPSSWDSLTLCPSEEHSTVLRAVPLLSLDEKQFEWRGIKGSIITKNLF